MFSAFSLKLKSFHITIVAIACLVCFNFTLVQAGEGNLSKNNNHDNQSYDLDQRDANIIINDGYYNTNNYSDSLALAPEYQSYDNGNNRDNEAAVDQNQPANDPGFNQAYRFDQQDFNTAVNDVYYGTNNYSDSLELAPEYSSVDNSYAQFDYPSQHDINVINNDIQYSTSNYSKSLDLSPEYAQDSRGFDLSAANIAQSSVCDTAILTSNTSLGNVVSELSSAFINSSLPASITPAIDLVYSADNFKSLSPIYKGIVGNDRSGKLEAPEITIGEAMKGPLLPGYYKIANENNYPIYYMQFVNSNQLNDANRILAQAKPDVVLRGFCIPEETITDFSNQYADSSFLKHSSSGNGELFLNDFLKLGIIKKENDGQYSPVSSSLTISADSYEDNRRPDTILHELNHAFYAAGRWEPNSYGGAVDRLWHEQPKDFQDFCRKLTFTTQEERPKVIKDSNMPPDHKLRLYIAEDPAPTEFAAYLADFDYLYWRFPEVRSKIDQGWQPLMAAHRDIREILPAELKPYYADIK